MYLVKRKKIYHLIYHDEYGQLVSRSTKSTVKSEANRVAIKYLEEVKNGTRTKPLTYEEFQIFYKKYASARFTKSYQEFVGYAFSQFQRSIDKKQLLQDITELNIERFVQLKLSEAGARIINGYLRTLQGAFQRAVDLGYIQKNVFKNVKKLKVEENLPAFLTKEEVEMIIAAENNQMLKLLYRFAAYTGMRMAEIRFLKWESIDLKTGIVQVRNHNEFTTKSKKARVIPLHPTLVGELDKISLKSSLKEYIFQQDGKVLDKRRLSEKFKIAVVKAELSDEFHFHSLRHTFASWLVQKGVSIYDVSKLLGHADIKTTQIYTHLRNEDLKDAVDKLV